MTNGRMEYLYARCMANDASDKEREELIDLIRLPENAILAKHLLYQAILDDGEKVSVDLSTSESIIQAILYSDTVHVQGVNVEVSGREIPLEAPMVIRQKPPFLKTLWIRYAAAVLLLICAGAYFWPEGGPLREFAANTAATPSMKNDVAPGGNRAVLTLSDGSTILLDSAANGKLTQQGGSQVLKLADGNLSYTAAENKDQKAVFNTMTTPRGGQYKLRLPDGSDVWLNAASSITYPTAFTGNERRITMTGEAYFEVARDIGKPFYVEANGTTISVLGTHFNVNAYSGEPSMKTTLLEGSVKISNGSTSGLLQPGQQAQVKQDRNMQIFRDVDTDEAIAWKNGYFQFNNADMQSVMKQLERWYDIEVSYEGAIPDRSFGGGIQRSLPLSKVLTLLEENEVKFQIDGRKIKVLR